MDNLANNKTDAKVDTTVSAHARKKLRAPVVRGLLEIPGLTETDLFLTGMNAAHTHFLPD